MNRIRTACTSLLLLTAVIAVNGTARAGFDPTAVGAYIGHSLGDTLPTFANGGRARPGWCQVYAFVDPGSCFTCMALLRSLEQWAATGEPHVNLVVFMSGKGSRYVDEQKRRYGWNFTVVPDPIFAYRDRYCVRVLPSVIMTNDAGMLVLAGKCGGELGLNDIMSVYRSEQARPAAAATGPLRETRRVVMVDSTGAPVIASTRTYCLWAPRTMVVFDAGFSVVHVVDTAGHVTRTWSLARQGVRGLSSYEPSWAEGDSVLLCVNIGTNPMGQAVMYLFNIRSGNVTRLPFSDSMVRKSYYNQMHARYIADGARVMVGIQPRAHGLATADMHTLLLFDTATAEQRTIGPLDTSFARHAMIDVLSPILAIGADGRVYVSQSPTRRLDVYERDGRQVRALYPSYGNTRRDFAEDMIDPGDSLYGYWVGINQRTSETSGIYAAEDGNEVDVVYTNAHYPNGTGDPHADDAWSERFLHRMSADGRPLDREDIRLPDGCDVFHAEPGKLAGGFIIDDHLEIVWYRIEEVTAAR